jgi:DNA-binding CsgD family transcriptional regulator
VGSWGLSAAEQDEVWRRWREGQSLRLIARRLGKRGPSVRAFVLQTGGVQRQQRAVSQHGRTRGDQPRGGRWPVVPAARGPAEASPVDGVAGVGS